MADVELDNVANGRHRLDIVVVESMARMDCDSEPCGEPCCHPQAFQLFGLLRTFMIGVSARMQLHNRRPDPGCGLDLPRLRINEQGHPDTVTAEGLHGLGEPRD